MCLGPIFPSFIVTTDELLRYHQFENTERLPKQALLFLYQIFMYIVEIFSRFLNCFLQIYVLNFQNISTRYLKDFFTSMIGAPWHWTILSFAASFFFSWFLFAVVWFLVALTHGERQRNIIKPISSDQPPQYFTLSTFNIQIIFLIATMI